MAGDTRQEWVEDVGPGESRRTKDLFAGRRVVGRWSEKPSCEYCEELYCPAWLEQVCCPLDGTISSGIGQNAICCTMSCTCCASIRPTSVSYEQPLGTEGLCAIQAITCAERRSKPCTIVTREESV